MAIHSVTPPSLTSARVFCNRGFHPSAVIGDELFAPVEARRAAADVDVALRVRYLDTLLFEEAVDLVADGALDDEVAARLVRPDEQAEVERGVGELRELHGRLRLFEDELDALGGAQQHPGDVVGVGVRRDADGDTDAHAAL